ncbi:MAG: HlyD family secretion protein [Candidatus Acidiferrales bacterium]
MPQKTEIDTAPEIETSAPASSVSDHSAAPPPRNASPAASRRPLPGWLILGAVVVIVVVGIFVWNYFAMWESTDDAQVDGHINALSARVGGYVTKVNVNDNQAVEAGAVLVEIDPKDYQVAVERAKAEFAAAEASAMAAQHNVPIILANSSSQLESARADVENARAGISAAQGQAAAALAQLAQAEANDSKAQSDVERYKQLVAKQEISQQQYESALDAAKATAAGAVAAKASAAAAEDQVHQARSRLLQAQATLQAAETAPQQVLVSKAQFSSADASVAQKKSALDQAMLNLQYCTIVAPVAGVVSKNVEVGNNVQPGQQLLSVVPLDDVWVTANFKETQLKYMRPGQPVKISVDAYGRTYNGHVDSIAGASGARFSLLPPENATGNYVKVVQRVPVKIVLEPGQNNDHLLRPGMSVTPKVKVK